MESHLSAEDSDGLHSTVLVHKESEVAILSVSHQLLPLQTTHDH